MKLHYVIFASLIYLISCDSLHAMSITGDRITTKAGSISFSELINLSRNYYLLRNAYICSTLGIIGYLAYERQFKRK